MDPEPNTSDYLKKKSILAPADITYFYPVKSAFENS